MAAPIYCPFCHGNMVKGTTKTRLIPDPKNPLLLIKCVEVLWVCTSPLCEDPATGLRTTLGLMYRTDKEMGDLFQDLLLERMHMKPKKVDLIEGLHFT